MQVLGGKRWAVVTIALVVGLFAGALPFQPASALITPGGTVDSPPPCTRNWSLGSTTVTAADFTQAANWNEEQIVGSGDTVCFSGVDVVVLDGAVSVTSVQLSNGATVRFQNVNLDLNSISTVGGVRLLNSTLTTDSALRVPAGTVFTVEDSSIEPRFGAPQVEVDGTMDWIRARIHLSVVNNGTVGVEAGFNELFEGTTFTNNALVEIAGIVHGTNDSEGIQFDLRSDPNAATNVGAPPAFAADPVLAALLGVPAAVTKPNAVFDNTETGTVRFAGGPNDINTPNRMTGELDFVQRGRVELAGDTRISARIQSTGTWELGVIGSATCPPSPFTSSPPSSATRLYLDEASHVFSGGQFTGNGCVVIAGGTVNVESDATWNPSSTQLSAGDLAFTGQDRTLGKFEIGGGIVRAAGVNVTFGQGFSPLFPDSSINFGGSLGGTITVDSTAPAITLTGESVLTTIGDVQVTLPVDVTTNGAIAVQESSRLTLTGRTTLQGEATVDVEVNANLRNEGTIVVEGTGAGVQFRGQRGIDNIGTIRVASGQLRSDTAPVQFVGTVLQSGRYEIANEAEWINFPLITDLGGTLQIEGSGVPSRTTDLDHGALADLRTVLSTGQLVLRSALVTIPQPLLSEDFSNLGLVDLDVRSELAVTRYIQGASGTLAVEVGRFADDPSSGVVSASDTSSINGTLRVRPLAVDQQVMKDVVVLEADNPQTTPPDPPVVPTQFATVSSTDGGVVQPTYRLDGDVVIDYTASGGIAPIVVLTPTVAVQEKTDDASTGRTATFSVRNDNPEPVTVSWSAVAGTAALSAVGEPLADARLVAGTVSVPVGESTIDIPLDVNADATVEDDETIVLRLQPGGVTATITIVDDDPPPFTAELVGPTLANESDGVARLRIRFAGATATLTKPVVFDVSTTDGTAIAGTDYEALDGLRVTIPAGATQSDEFTVRVFADGDFAEADTESFTVIARHRGTEVDSIEVPIADDDERPTARFERADGEELDVFIERDFFEGSTVDANPDNDPSTEFTIAMSTPIVEPVVVDIAVTEVGFGAFRTGAAVPAADDEPAQFTLSATQVTLTAEEPTATVRFAAVPDTQPETDRRYEISLVTASGRDLGTTDDSAFVIVKNDDIDLVLTPTIDSPVNEGDDVTVTITADHEPGVFVNVPISIEAISAAAGTDLDLTDVPSSISFRPEDTEVSFTIPTVEDDAPETDETFAVVLGPPAQGTFADGASTSRTEVTIADDDPGRFILSLDDTTVDENAGIITLQLRVIPTVSQPGTVQLPILVDAPGGDVNRPAATIGEDFGLRNFSATGTIQVPADGGTVDLRIDVIDDAVFDLPERFRVSVGRPSVPTERISAITTIIDNEPVPTLKIQNAIVFDENIGEGEGLAEGEATYYFVLVGADGRIVRPGSPLVIDSAIVGSGDATVGSSCDDQVDGEAADATTSPRTTTFERGDNRSPSVTFRICNDSNPIEFLHESFVISASGHGLFEDQTVGAIRDDDQGGVVRYRFTREPGDAKKGAIFRSAAEGDTRSEFRIRVERSGSIEGSSTATVEVLPFSNRAAGTVIAPPTLNFAAGQEFATLVVTIVGDTAVESDDVAVITIGGPEIRSIESADDAVELTVTDDDRQASERAVAFVRPSASDTTPLERSITEGDNSAVTVNLPVAVNLSVTEPVEVSVVARCFDCPEDYTPNVTVEPALMEFQPGGQPQTVTLTVPADQIDEPDVTIVVSIISDADLALERVTDTAHIRVIDDDGPDDTDGLPHDVFQDAWNELADAITRTIDSIATSGSGVTPAPVVNDDFGDYFGLQSKAQDVATPQLAGERANDMGELCQKLLDAGATLDFVEGGLCGAPDAAAGDFLQARYTVTLEDIAKAAGFTGDSYEDDTDDVLTSLATGLGLDAAPEDGWVGDLTVDLIVGVDDEGFYVARGSRIGLDVSGTVSMSGSAEIGDGSPTLTGSATGNLTIEVAPTAARHRDLAALGDPTIDGTAGMTLGFEAGPLDLTWQNQWTVTDGVIEPGDQTITGHLVLDGLESRTVVNPDVRVAGATTARVEVVGVLSGDTWTITGQGSADLSHTLLGFTVEDLSFDVTVSPTVLEGTGSMHLLAPVPGSTATVDVTAAFGRGRSSFTGRFEAPTLTIGDPALATLTDAFVTVDMRLDADALLTGSVEIGAASATLGSPTPFATATGLNGTLTTEGDLGLLADTLHVEVADGAFVLDLTDAALQFGDGTGPDLFTADTAIGTFPTLDDLSVTFEGFGISKAGAIRASRVLLDSDGVARSIGLGGILPFDVTDVVVTFDDPTDLDAFQVEVEGRFDFDAFPAGFSPRLGLGGPTVTRDTPDEENIFRFSVDVESLSEGVVRPLDVGPITLGFDDLPVGNASISAEINLGGFVDGVFQTDIGGALTIDGPSGSPIDEVEVELDGTLVPGATADDPTVVDISGTVTVSGTFGPVEVTDLAVVGGARMTFDADGFTITGRIDGASVGRVVFPLGDFMTLTGTGIEFDPSPDPDGMVLTVPTDGSIGVTFGDSFPGLAGWGGSASGVALAADFTPVLLDGFGFDLTAPDDFNAGLPPFIPVEITELGISLPRGSVGPDGTIRLTPALFDGMRIRVSGGIRATETWPISAAVDGLELDLGLLADGEFPITNLEGFSMGVEPFELPGDVVIGGGLEIGTIDVPVIGGGTEMVFYGRIFGEFSVAGMGGGAELVVTEYGPVLMKVQAPLGIPLGPTGIVLAGVEGAAQFGDVNLPVPPTGNPTALLNNVTLPTDLVITEQVLIDAVTESVEAETYTWEQGFALSLAGDITVVAAPGVISGRVTLGMALGFPASPQDPAGIQIVGKGEVTAYGIPLGQAGLLIDLSPVVDPETGEVGPPAPKIDLAFASPVPGSPLAVAFPASATFGVQVRTDGVILGTVVGLRAFATTIADGLPGVGQEFFTVVTDVIARRLDADHSRPLATLLLDLDGNGTLSPAEDTRTITSAFLFDRVLGRNGIPALLPAELTDTTIEQAMDAATAFMNELMLIGGEVVANPTKFSATLVDADSAEGFESLTGAGGEALAALGDLIRDATAAALDEFGARFNPSFTIEGALQPTLLGLPLGAPTASGRLFIDRNGLFFEMEGSLVDISKTVVSTAAGPAAPLLSQLITLSTVGLRDRIAIGARLPFGGIVDSLIGGADLPTFQPLDPNWAVSFTGTLDVVGFEAAEVRGLAVLPGQETFLSGEIQKLYELAPDQPVLANKIPVTTQAHFDALVEYGGIILTSSLRVPRLVTEPSEQLASFPPMPENPVRFLEWLDDIARKSTETDTPARIQMFVPGIIGLSDEASAVEWARQFYVEGVWDGDVLDLDLGRGIVTLTPEGLDVEAALPFGLGTGNVIVNTNLLDGGGRLPTAGVDVAVDAAGLLAALEELGIPADLLTGIEAGGRFRAYTPGFDPDSDDPLEKFGGIELTATASIEGLVEDAEFTFSLAPNGSGGIDVHAQASVASVGPLGGVGLRNATIDIDVVDGAVSVDLSGRIAVGNRSVVVTGTLDPDLTGDLTVTVGGAGIALAGVTMTGTVRLTLDRVDGDLVGALGVSGRATLPAWVATGTGATVATAAACIDTNSNVDIAVVLPALSFGPNRVVRVTKANGAPTLPDSQVGCTPPEIDTSTPAPNGPTFRFRKAGDDLSAAFDGAMQFTTPGRAIAGMRITGSVDTASGTGSLDVSFAGEAMTLGGFTVSVTTAATVTVGPGTFSMTVEGSMDVGDVLEGASVSGSLDERGISSLTVGVESLDLSPLEVSDASASIVRGASGYSLSLGATVTVDGIGSVRVDGALASNGTGTLTIGTDSLAIAGVTVTDGVFSVVRTLSATKISVSGSVSVFGTTLNVTTAELTITSSGGVDSISGRLDLTVPGGAPLRIGGWAMSGTLRISFSGLTSRLSIVDGRLTIPGWGTLNVSANVTFPLSDGSFFTVSTPTGGLRIGGSDSPFFASGSLKVTFSDGVGTFALTGGTLRWKDGTTTLARVPLPSLTVSTDGSARIELEEFSATLGDFSFTVPSLDLFVDVDGLNARLSLGEGSVSIPGLPTLDTPAFEIRTATTFSHVLVDDVLDLGLVELHADLVFERTDGVFRLALSESSRSGSPFVRIEGLVDVPLPSVTIASNGTFVIEASVPTFGAGGVRVVGASMMLRKTGAGLDTLSGSITGGKLLVLNAEPINLPSLSFGGSTRFDETFEIPTWDLGPFVRLSTGSGDVEVRVRQLASGNIRMSLVNDPTVSILADTASMTITSLSAESDGTLTGSVNGELNLFGLEMAQGTFDISNVGGVFELRLPNSKSRRARLDLGFVSARMSGFVNSNGQFSFTGSTSVGFGFPGLFSFSGSTSVTISSAVGIDGSFEGEVCVLLICGSAEADLRSDGRLSGTLRVKVNNDSDFKDAGEIEATFRVFLGTGGVRVDTNFDGDFSDTFDIRIGDMTSRDDVKPSMSSPPDITVRAVVGTGGRVRVWFAPPTATDDGAPVPVSCSSMPGVSLGLGERSVTCTARDEAGNVRERSFTISVVSKTSGAPTATNDAIAVVTSTGLLGRGARAISVPD